EIETAAALAEPRTHRRPNKVQRRSRILRTDVEDPVEVRVSELNVAVPNLRRDSGEKRLGRDRDWFALERDRDEGAREIAFHGVGPRCVQLEAVIEDRDVVPTPPARENSLDRIASAGTGERACEVTKLTRRGRFLVRETQLTADRSHLLVTPSVAPRGPPDEGRRGRDASKDRKSVV